MIVYWSMYVIPALLAVLLYRSDRQFQLIGTVIILAGFFLVMAFRETGGDWFTYIRFYTLFEGESFQRITGGTDFLYGLANWISMQLGWGMAGTNGICAAIFLFAFYMFARHEPYPLLALAVATAYFIIVVGIGYTRQGVAASLLLWGTVFLRHKEPWKYLTILVLAIGFHASAAFGLIFIYFALNITDATLRRIVASGLVLFSILALLQIQSDTFDRYVSGYVESDRYSSDGAVIRLAMSWVAAVVFVFLFKSWPKSDRMIWGSYAAISILLLPVLAISSTVADRLGLYMIALQIAVFGRLPMFGQTATTRTAILLGTLVLYGTVLGVWLLVGNFASVLWLPFESSLFGVIG